MGHASNLEEILVGEWWPAGSPWESRRDAMLDVLGKATPYIFTPALQIDPVAGRLLIEALSGRWSYEKEARRDRRNIWFHVANAFSLLVARMAQSSNNEPLKKIDVNLNFNALDRSTWAGGRR
jgi:hypothetical protein